MSSRAQRGPKRSRRSRAVEGLCVPSAGGTKAGTQGLSTTQRVVRCFARDDRVVAVHACTARIVIARYRIAFRCLIMRGEDLRRLTLPIYLLLCCTTASSQVTVIKAGKLVDPDLGTVQANQVIVISANKIEA